MKSIKPISILSACVVVALAFGSQAKAPAAIAAIYAKLDAVTLKKDVAGFSKLLGDVATKDCTIIDSKGKSTSASKTMASMAKELAQFDKVNKSSSHIDKTVDKGSTVVLTVSSVLDVTAKSPDGKAHQFVQTSTSDDTWVKVGSSWKLKLSKTTKEKTTLDGKPYSM